MKICWKQGSQYNIDARIAHREVEKVAKACGGEASAEEIVKAATPAKNPLHGVFEWNDTVAGQEYRLEQARRMVRSIVVVRPDTTSKRPQRVWEAVRVNLGKPGRPRNTYKTLEDIMRDPNLRAELLGRALRDLIAIRNRYRDLQELAVVMRAIDDLLSNTEP